MPGSAILPARRVSTHGSWGRCKHTRLTITAPHLLQIVIGTPICRGSWTVDEQTGSCKAQSRGVQGQIRAHTLGVVGFAFPAHVLLIQNDVLAGNPQRKPVPQHDRSLFVVSLLDHCDSATE